MPELIPAKPGVFVRELGRVTGLDGIPVTVGVDYGAVTVSGCKLAGTELEEFARLFVAALWQAAADSVAAALAEEDPKLDHSGQPVEPHDEGTSYCTSIPGKCPVHDA